MRSETAYGNGVFTMIKATLFALAISLLAVMAVAVVYRAGGMQERGLYAVNQAVKGVSIAVGSASVTASIEAPVATETAILGAQRVSPIEMSSQPEKQTMSPTLASVTGTLLSPSN